jgi:hypothetical protein
MSGFVLCGTAPTGWLALGRSLQAAWAAQGLEAPTLAEDVSALPHDGVGDARYVAFIESPARALIAAAAEESPAAVLQTWSRSARQLLLLARQRPTRWYLVDADEARAAPAALADQMAGWGLDLRLTGLDDTPQAPLARHLAEAVVVRQWAVRRLHDELLASCVPLLASDSPATRPADPEQLWRAHAEAQARLAEREQALLSSRASLAAFGSEQALLLAQLRVTQQALEAQVVAREQSLSEARTAQDAVKAELSASRADTAARDAKVAELSARVDRAQHQVARLTEELAQASKSQNELRAETAALRDEGVRVSLELTAEREQLRQGLAASAEDHAAKIRAAEMRASEANRDRHDLLVQLHHVQEVLESSLLEHRELADALAAQRLEVGVTESAQVMQVVRVHEGGVHRHIDLRLEDVRLGERRLETMTLRLVEHSGHPGFLFWPEADSLVLHAWRKNGDEDGREFMLLLPWTAEGREDLLRLGRLDWQLVLGLARLLQRKLGEEPEPGCQCWAATASRLLRELESLPERLRYDALRLRHTGDAVLEVVFQGACHGDRDLGDIALQWAPMQRRLQWLAPSRIEHLPLSSWPSQADGTLQPLMDLPVGSEVAGTAHRGHWARVNTADQALMLAVLDALPAVARTTLPGDLPQQLTPAYLADLAQALHKQARRTLASLRARSLVRRLVRGRAAR